MTQASIGVNLRVTGHCSQGGRKYMEDFFSVAYQQSEDEKDLEYAFFGIYDGHGGSEAATYAKEHLMNAIVSQKLFWSDCDQDILRAIREGYIATHYAMWREQEKWPKTATGLPSTAGTTASVAFIRRSKIYIGHVGDSGIVLGYQEEGDKCWKAKPLTHDHKPECNVEKARIMNAGGKVVTKSGVPRVVWNRPRIGHKGPVRRSTPIDEIPFLAVARSLGDLWSYNSALNEFVVSPDPDVRVVKIDPKTFRCLIFGTDGLWNVLCPMDAVDLVKDTEVMNERITYLGGIGEWTNPSKCLVDKALGRWCSKKMRADNTSVVTIMLDPPGPPKKEMVGNCPTTYGLEYIHEGVNVHPGNEYTEDGLIPNYSTLNNSTMAMFDQSIRERSECHMTDSYTVPTNGYAIMTRYENNCDNNILYCEDSNDMMSSNNLTSLPPHCSNTVIPANSSTSHTEPQYMNSFAESYNSLLISSYEDESDSMNVEGLAIEADSQEYHSYNSLEESGIVGQDHVYHHHPHSIHQQQQHQYQQQCMSAEEGYSLTKLETRCEQQFKQDVRNINHQHPILNTSHLTSFQEFEEPNRYNEYNNITSSYRQPVLSNNKQNDYTNKKSSLITNQIEIQSNEFEDDETKFYDLNSISTEENKDCNFTTIDISILPEEDDSNSNEHLLLDESIQINEISSSMVEVAVSIVDEIQNDDTEEPSNTDVEMESYKTNECDEQKTPQTRRSVKQPYQNQETRSRNRIKSHSQKSFSIEQNENISILEPRKLRSTVNSNQRCLRSRNSLGKEMKAKSTVKKQQQVRKNLNNCLKISNSTTTVSSAETPSRSRQIQQEQITVWSPRQRRSKAPIIIHQKADSSVKSSNSLKNKPKTLCNNAKLQSKTLSSSTPFIIKNSLPSSPFSVTSSSSLIVSSSTPSIGLSKRSSTSKNSAWCSSKSAVQTRNRVQKRISH